MQLKCLKKRSSWKVELLGAIKIFKFLRGLLEVTVMSEVVMLLKEIREGLREIKLSFYKGLVERLMPIRKPLKDEMEAIESGGEVVSEKGIMEALN